MSTLVEIASYRESHSEIERKRRERMKRDTEFLRKQVSNTQCKDKLSIFQAGAEKLIQYTGITHHHHTQILIFTDKLGKREYIINDEEYSQIIMNNFDGFDIHVRCSDGKVLKVHENIKKILDVAVVSFVCL
ncbi:Aryl hydrocarbon receptor nuclear translocator [Fasciolopsis buskii]|uniref:Aryl hydrocarbon receptor nuclear translocator n=1 Tax=Fasciolopsis buskii TaxID=27845 RepID=A0A8E0VH67_9TREM|nr:Aryl hydrocarbon receptor nuclear translocator [Fasciolopsis buski]